MPEGVAHVVLTRDSRYVLALLDGRRSVAVLPAVMGRAAILRSNDGRVCAALAPDAAISFTGGWGDVLAVDTRTLMPLWRRNVSWGWCTAIACTASGDRVAVAFDSSNHNELIMLDGGSGNTLWTYSPTAEHPGDPRFASRIQAATFSSDEGRVFIAFSAGHGRVIDASTGRPQETLAFPAEVGSFVASPDRRWVVITSPRPKDAPDTGSPTENRTLHVLDGTTAQTAWSIPTPFLACDACWSLDNQSVFISADDRVARVACDTRRISWSCSPPSGARFRVLATTPDGGGLLLYRESGYGLVLNAQTGEPRVELPLPIDLPIAAEFQRDGGTLMVAGVYAPGESFPASISATELAERARTRAAWELLERLPQHVRFLSRERVAAQLQSYSDVSDEIRSRAVEICGRLGFSARWANSEVVKMLNQATAASPESLADAEQIAARCISEFPSAAAPHLLRARALQLLGRHEEALTVMDNSEPLMTPGFMRDAHTVQRGISLAFLGQIEKARELSDSVRQRAADPRATDPYLLQLLVELDASISPNQPPRPPP